MASGPGGQEIGRVSVKVVPDTSDFDKQKLERRLNKEVKDANVKITVALDIDKKALQKVRDDLRHWAKKISPLKIEVKPELALGSTTLINTRLNYAARARTAPILPYLAPGSVNAVTAQIGTMLAAFSGGRVIKNVVSDFGNFIKRLDETAPKMALITQGLVGIVGLGLTAGSNLFALSSSLASIGAVGLTLPATFASAAIGVGVLVAAFKDFNKVLPGVKGELAKLQDLISGNFWEKAKAPFQEMITTLFPLFSKGLGSVATEFGNFFGSLASSLGTALAPSIGGMFTQLSASIAIMQEAASPLAQTISTIGSIGAAYLPKMASWILTIATQFNTWLSNAAADGSLTTWIDNGLAALSELGQVLKNVYTIFSGIATAATAAGGSSLGMVADTLKSISDAVNNPAFQGALVQTLRGAHEAMNQIATVSGPAVSKFFESLGSTLGVLLPVAGQAIGSVLGALATAFSDPAFIGGFENLIKGMADMLAGLTPAIGPIAAMFGALGSVLGQFLSNMGPLLGSVLGGLAAAITPLLPALQPIISILTGALAGAFQQLMPVVTILGAVLAKLAVALGPVLATAAEALMPVIGAIADVLMVGLMAAMKAILPLLPMIANAFTSLAPLVAQLITAFAPLVGALLPALGAILGAIIPVIVMVAQAVLPPLIAAVTALVGALVPVVGVIAQVVTWLVTMLAPVIVFVAGLLIGIVTGIINGFTNIFEGIMGIWDGFVLMFSGGWSNFFAGLWQVVVGVWNLIIGVIEVALNIGILGAVKKAFTAIKGLFSLGWGAVKGATVGALNGIKAFFSLFLGALKNSPKAALAELKALFSMAWDTIKSKAVAAFTALTKTIPQKIGEVIGFVRGIPGKAVSALGNIGTKLTDAGSKLIGGFVTGIRNAFGNVKDTLQGLTKKLTDWKGPESLDRVLLVNAGELVMGGFLNGLESQYDTIRKSLRGFTADLGRTDITGLSAPDLSGSFAAVNSALAGPDAAGSQGGTTYEINVPTMPTNSSPEDVADAILHAQKRYAYGSAYAM